MTYWQAILRCSQLLPDADFPTVAAITRKLIEAQIIRATPPHPIGSKKAGAK
jgi:hypothetical protein